MYTHLLNSKHVSSSKVTSIYDYCMKGTYIQYISWKTCQDTGSKNKAHLISRNIYNERLKPTLLHTFRKIRWPSIMKSTKYNYISDQIHTQHSTIQKVKFIPTYDALYENVRIRDFTMQCFPCMSILDDSFWMV